MSAENILTIRNDFESYQRLINLYFQNKDEVFDNINIDITGWSSANSCSMLGAILTKFQNNLNTVTINAGSAENILERNNFLSFFGYKKISDYNNTTIPYLLTHDSDFKNADINIITENYYYWKN